MNAVTEAVAAGKKIEVQVVYNGITKTLQLEPNEQVTAVLARAIAIFGIAQNPHLLSLYRQDGSLVPEQGSVEAAGIKAGETLLLRPNAVKGGGGLLRIAHDAVRSSFRWFRECGRGEYECVVYWIGPADEDAVDAVEHPVHSRSPFGYQLNDPWLTQFWNSLAASRRSIKAQVHTHPGEAFHSAVDDQWPVVSLPGFLSIVIPDFAAGDPSLDHAWIGRLEADGRWKRVPFVRQALLIA